MIVTVLNFVEKLFTHGRDWYYDRYRAQFCEKVIYPRQRLIL